MAKPFKRLRCEIDYTTQPRLPRVFVQLPDGSLLRIILEESLEPRRIDYYDPHNVNRKRGYLAPLK